MRNNLKVFNNPEFGDIRVVDVNGKSYFVAVYVARALGYVKSEDAVKRHCRHPLKDGVGVQTGTKRDGIGEMKVQRREEQD